ncbi:MAG TPA: hypothetical protein VK188_04400 [Holophaga sp.]|nr:hypothetical protein [Holophaga sp.]
MKKLTLAALALVAVAPLSAANWSDTSLTIRRGNDYKEPGIAESVAKTYVAFSHVSGDNYGGNFFNVDMIKSDGNDPMNSEGPGTSGGAQEVYCTYKHNWSLSKLFGKKMEFGPVRDVEFVAGFDYAAKNTRFAPAVYKLMAGPQFSFKVPGFLTVAALYYKEKNHNSFGTFNPVGHMDVTFDATYQIAAAWGINVPLGSVSTVVKGFGTLTGAKGKDGSNVETKPETLVNLHWMFDFSEVVGTKKGSWLIGPGVQYWDNKFGDPTYEKDAVRPAGTVVNPRTKTLQFSIEYHF